MNKHLPINPFATPAELAAVQAFAEREQWRLECRALGATREQIRSYEESARAFAATTPHPNSVMVESLQRAAIEALARGEGMPTDAEQAIQSMFARELARIFGV